MIRNNRIVGYIGAEYVYSLMFENTVKSLPYNLGIDYNISVAINNQVVYSRLAPDGTRRDELTVDKTVVIAGRRAGKLFTAAALG